ncbi:protein Jumonji isoform X2 [Lingula anatina]|uniref:Protein Jumonji isoform X2 n=1 Tax=Lingula anatina TaxID=7574 RepID=A0A1S3HX73_LINAN|nr:protein Jumonji isoform X2 [Lingula anatina]|eukprot:XP_013389664.1 protein Jumonji isoform X2 [Lingula anatina]
MNRDFQVEFLSYVKQKVVETEVKGRRHSSHGMTYAVRKSSPIRPLKTKPSCSSPVRTDTKLRRKQPSFTGGASLQLSSKSDSGESMPPVKKNVKRDPCIPAVPLLAERPKRTIIPKNLDESAGLSWREETDLKKALLASLRESKRQELEEQVELELKQSLIKPSSSGSSSIHKSKPSRQVSKESKEVESLTQKVDSPVSWGMKTPQHKTLSHNKGSKGISKAAMTTDYVSDSPSVKVRAQRKFAQGQGVCSAPSSPSPSVNMTPVKIQASASPASSGKKRHLVATKRAKTEDFLTFLCLRGTPALPKKLNFFNYPPVMTEKVTRPANMVKLSRNGGRGNTTPVKYEDGNSRDSFDLDVSPLPRDTPPRRPFSKHSDRFPRASSPPPNLSPVKPIAMRPTPTKSRVPPPLLPIEPLKKYESKKVMTRSESAVKLKKLQVTVTRLRSGKVAYSHHHKSPFKTYHKVQKLKKTKEAISEKIKAKKSKKTDGGEERGESQKMKKNKDSVDTNEKKKSAKQKVVKKKLNTDDSKPMKMLPLEEPSRKKTKTLVSHEKPLTQGKSRAKPIKDGAKSKGTTKDHPKRKIKTEVTTNMPIKQEKLKKETDDEMHSTTDKGMLTRRGRASSVPHSDEIEITFKTIMPKIPSKQCLSSHCSNSSRSSKVSLGKRKFEGSEHKDSIGVEQHISGTLPAKLSKKNTDIPQGSKLRSQSSGAVTEESCEKKRCHPGERARRVTSTMSSRAKNNLIKMPVSNKRGRPTAKSSPTSERMKETVKGNEEAVQLSEAPMYSPAANEFVDPIDFIEAIKPNAEQQGMCKIIPPQEVWKPECKVRDDMRFVYQIQHVHKMYKRWGPNVQHVECIKRQLEAQGGGMEHPPNVGGIELDLSRLQQAIQSFGGMQTVLAKNILPKVCDALNIPRMALDRMSRLYDAYCKYLVPYDTLTTEEKEKLDQQVSMMRQKKKRVEDDCVLKGKSTSLGNFYRVARNTKLMWFTKEEPSPEQVEHEYWKIVTERQVHVAVHAGHVGTQHWGSGFPNKRENQYYRHGWNFNNVPENANNLLKVLGTIESVTTPTLHIGMLFSTSCWSRDPHLLPYIVYNHTGADVIWYCIPGSETQKFQTAMKKLVPSLVTDQPVWLPEDTVMISPRLLLMEGVSVNRTVQSAGQFIAVFPESFTATLSCGYNVLESVHFAPSSWIPLGRKADGLLSESSESQLFPVEQLFCSLVRDDRTPVDTLKLVLPELTAVIEEENSARQQLLEAGLHSWEKMELPDDPFPGGKRKKSFETLEEEDNVCEICKKICYFSMVVNESEDAVYCLKHALPHVQKKKNLKACKVMFRCTEKELQSVIDNTRDRIEALSNTSTSSRKRQAKVKVC